MQRTAACIAIANKSALITPRTISNENGAIAAARRAITFLIVRYSSAKCEWARTLQTSVPARSHRRNRRPLVEAPVLLVRLQHKERRLRRLLHQLHHLRQGVSPQRRAHCAPARLHHAVSRTRVAQ